MFNTGGEITSNHLLSFFCAMIPTKYQRSCIKGKYPDAIAFYNVGDNWCECYGADVAKVTKLVIVAQNPANFVITANSLRVKADYLDNVLPSIVREGWRCAIIQDLNFLPKSVFAQIWRAFKAFINRFSN